MHVCIAVCFAFFVLCLLDFRMHCGLLSELILLECVSWIGGIAFYCEYRNGARALSDCVCVRASIKKTIELPTIPLFVCLSRSFSIPQAVRTCNRHASSQSSQLIDDFEWDFLLNQALQFIHYHRTLHSNRTKSNWPKPAINYLDLHASLSRTSAMRTQ